VVEHLSSKHLNPSATKTKSLLEYPQESVLIN
jgi:hypothetical protein